MYLHESPDAELVAVVDTDNERAQRRPRADTGARRSQSLPSFGQVDAAIVAAPTAAHAGYRVRSCSNTGSTSWWRSPSRPDLASAERLIDTAEANGRILQVGHLERFNPAVQAVQRKVTLPLFFEIHRMSMFSPRSLDVDVVLDLMIHDIDVVLALTGLEPEEIRAAGIRILSDKVDIANVRLAFPGGCVANLTASRVSTEKIRKIRLFQPTSIHFARLPAAGCRSVYRSRRPANWASIRLRWSRVNRCDWRSKLPRMRPNASDAIGDRAGCARGLAVALAILAKIEEHGAVVADTLSRNRATP